MRILMVAALMTSIPPAPATRPNRRPLPCSPRTWPTRPTKLSG